MVCKSWIGAALAMLLLVMTTILVLVGVICYDGFTHCDQKIAELQKERDDLLLRNKVLEARKPGLYVVKFEEHAEILEALGLCGAKFDVVSWDEWQQCWVLKYGDNVMFVDRMARLVYPDRKMLEEARKK